MSVVSRLSLLMALSGASVAFAQTQGSASCSDKQLSPAAIEAKENLDRDPSILETRFKLAEELTAQECYEEAVKVLEEGEELHPQNATLEGRLRSARSMISEQRYIESVTRAEEGARLQRNLLRCRKLSDVEACDEALAVRRNDWELLVAKADAMVQQSRSGEALPVYRRAAELHPDSGLQAKIRNLEAQRTARAASTAPPAAALPQAQSPALARTEPVGRQKVVSYSNEAPPGRSH